MCTFKQVSSDAIYRLRTHQLLLIWRIYQSVAPGQVFFGAPNIHVPKFHLNLISLLLHSSIVVSFNVEFNFFLFAVLRVPPLGHGLDFPIVNPPLIFNLCLRQQCILVLLPRFEVRCDGRQRNT